MRLDTERLIRTLAADNAHRERPVGTMLAISLLGAVPFSLAIFLSATAFGRTSGPRCTIRSST